MSKLSFKDNYNFLGEITYINWPTGEVFVKWPNQNTSIHLIDRFLRAFGGEDQKRIMRGGVNVPVPVPIFFYEDMASKTYYLEDTAYVYA